MAKAPKTIAGYKVIGTTEYVYATTQDRARFSERYYRLANGILVGTKAFLDHGVRLGFGVIIEDECFIGSRTVIGPLSRIGDRTIIGSNTVIGHRTVVEHECDIGTLRIGDECHVGSLNYLDDGSVLGDNSLVPSEAFGQKRRLILPDGHVFIRGQIMHL